MASDSAESATPKAASDVVTVDFPGRDRLRAERGDSGWTVQVVGCPALSAEIARRLSAQKELTLWEWPQGQGHVDLLIRELILRARGEWDFPFREEELCHCRSVPAAVVDQAIVAGAHDCAQVSRRTTASTSCGTCRPDVQQIIDYRLSRKS